MDSMMRPVESWAVSLIVESRNRTRVMSVAFRQVCERTEGKQLCVDLTMFKGMNDTVEYLPKFVLA